MTKIIITSVLVSLFAMGWVLWSQPIGTFPVLRPTLQHAAFAANRELDKARRLVLDHVVEPETVAIDTYGNLVSFNGDGVVRISTPKGLLLHEQKVGGRPLAGSVHRKTGRVYIANPVLGLQVMEPIMKKQKKHGSGEATDYAFTVRVATNATAAGPIVFPEDVDVSPTTGKVYFTDADTTLWPPAPLGGGRYDVITVARVAFLRAAQHGALIEFDPATDSTRVLVSDLRWGNGVAVAADGRFVLVCESMGLRIRRVWLEGPRAGENEVLVERLPGCVDGISRSSRPGGGFWVTVPIPLSPLLRFTMPRPWVRAVLHALPSAFIPQEKHTFAFVMAIDAEGRPLCSLQGGVEPSSGATTAPIAYITAATQEGEKMYLSSIEHDHLAVVDMSEVPHCLT